MTTLERLAAIRNRDALTVKANGTIERCRDQAKLDRSD